MDKKKFSTPFFLIFYLSAIFLLALWSVFFTHSNTEVELMGIVISLDWVVRIAAVLCCILIAYVFLRIYKEQKS